METQELKDRETKKKNNNNNVFRWKRKTLSIIILNIADFLTCTFVIYYNIFDVIKIHSLSCTSSRQKFEILVQELYCLPAVYREVLHIKKLKQLTCFYMLAKFYLFFSVTICCHCFILSIFDMNILKFILSLLQLSCY